MRSVSVFSVALFTTKQQRTQRFTMMICAAQQALIVAAGAPFKISKQAQDSSVICRIKILPKLPGKITSPSIH
jgi:hypothetical protein